MAVNRITTKIILDTVYRGFYYDPIVERYQLKILHITEQMLCNMQDAAKTLGQTLRRDDINLFLNNARRTEVIVKNYWYSLPVQQILHGEIIHFSCMFRGSMQYLELMKMTEVEFLIIETSIEELAERTFLSLFTDSEITCNVQIYIAPIGYATIVETNHVRPGLFYQYLNHYFFCKFHCYEVTDNLWPRYNELYELLESESKHVEFEKTLMHFSEDGLSTFVVRKMVDSIMRMKKGITHAK